MAVLLLVPTTQPGIDACPQPRSSAPGVKGEEAERVDRLHIANRRHSKNKRIWGFTW